MKRIFLLILAACVPLPLLAQGGTTQQRIDRAKQQYESFFPEQARDILQEIVSPGYLQPVTDAQRVTAYKYLGASMALLGQDSVARNFFEAALAFDAFTDLDPTEFSPAEMAAFNAAKLRIFKIGATPIDSFVVDPRADTSGFRFRLITTHRARLRVELTARAEGNLPQQSEVLLDGVVDGFRNIPWHGRWRDGNTVRPGVYELTVTGSSQLGQGDLTERLVMRIDHSHPPLEDTLRSFTEVERLRENFPGISPWRDLALGTVVGATAAGIAFLALSPDDLPQQWIVHTAGSAGLGISSGIISFMFRRRNIQIETNVQENRRREQERARFNAEVMTRNEARRAQTLLIIVPVS